MDNKIKAIEKDIRQLQDEPNIDIQDTIYTNITILENELKHLHHKIYKNTYTKAQVIWHDKGEKISKYWTAVDNSKCSKDIIYTPQDPQTNTLTTKTNEMSDIAHYHHKSLQDSN